MENILNLIFDRIYCINLDRRADRWASFLEEAKKFGISNVKRYSAVDGDDLHYTSGTNKKFPRSAAGLVMTNIGIMEECIRDKVDRVLILEDDVEFTRGISDMSNLDYIPEDWDSLYFGGNHNTHKGIPLPKMYNGGMIKISHTFSTHCVGFKGSFIPNVLDRIKKVNSPLDVAYTDLQKSHNFYCFYPALAVQKAGYSDIQNQTMDYSNWIK